MVEAAKQELSSLPVPVWIPNEGPQALAYLSQADELFYGGAAGGGKTDLLIGLGLTSQTRSLILRTEATQLQAIKDRVMAAKRPDDQWRSVGYGGTLNTIDGRKIFLSGCDGMQGAEKWRGNPHDAKLFDELCAFSEPVYRFINAWCRTTDPDQRCRIVGAGNPPARPEEEWVIRYWGPWLETNTAEPGELRWFIVNDEGKDIEVEDNKPKKFKGGFLTPRSRTFIPAQLKDNPDLERTGYRTALQGLPEPLRSQLLYGDMTAGLADDAWQLIPTAWVRQSMRSWTAAGHKNARVTCYSIDVARGGADRTVLCKRHGVWFDKVLAWPGLKTADGPALITRVLPHINDMRAPVLVDVLATAGGGAIEAFRYALPSLQVRPVNFGMGSSFKDRTGRLEMKNLRAEAYFRLREALDPASGKPTLLLPDDPELLSEICATRWKEISGGKVQLESKDDIKERLGRSPDKADAVAMSMLVDSNLSAWVSPEPKGDRNREREPKTNFGSYRGGPFMGVG